MPAGAVKRKVRVFSKIIGCKGCLGGKVLLKYKVQNINFVIILIHLILENNIEDCGISRVAIECVNTGENTIRRRQQSGYILTLTHETLGSN